MVHQLLGNHLYSYLFAVYLIIYFSPSFKYNDVAPTPSMNYNSMNNAVEQLQPEIFLPPSSPLGPGTLLISRDGEDDINSIRINTARTSTTEIEYQNTKSKPRINSKTAIPNDSNLNQEGLKSGCDILILLRTCWSWFCGLDDQEDQIDQDSSYQPLQQRNENGDTNEGHEFMLQHSKERPIIKWILNANLIFLILIEISLFVVFSLPVKYTFWRE
jgi:hypothetical protein